jgi:hypothetical protein
VNLKVQDYYPSGKRLFSPISKRVKSESLELDMPILIVKSKKVTHSPTPTPLCPSCGRPILVCSVCDGFGKITVNGVEKDCPNCDKNATSGNSTMNLGPSGFCPHCGMSFTSKEYSYSVRGSGADDVRKVLESLKSHAHPRSPWIAGSFYLAVAIIAVVAMLAVANTVPLYIVPMAIVGAILLVSVIGAFQLRHDSGLSEKSFLELMALSFRYLPLLRPKREDSASNKTKDESPPSRKDR